VRNLKVIMETPGGTVADSFFLRELVETGELRTAVDRAFPSEEIAEAHRSVERRRKIGNEVVTAGHNNTT
jgi:hypothetical protein